jgi:release factor glutamine methyltransferase
MRGLVKYIVSTTYRPLLVKYLSSARRYSYKGITLQVPFGVFHPGFFFSTKLLLRYIAKERLSQKSLLELGAGSGLLSIYSAKKGASVTATDISADSVECVRANAEENLVHISVIHSDLFDNIPHQRFDIILINPPYYKRTPVSPADYAWYCGENGEYFQRLFYHLDSYVHKNSVVLMVLCDGCDIQLVKKLAENNLFLIDCVHISRSLLETNYIFKIHRKG